MHGTKPVIGITGPDKGGAAAWIFTAISVILAGGMPVRIQPSNPKPEQELDGLILGGGADIEPLKYGEQRIEKAVLDKNKRSFFEWLLSIIFFPLYWISRYFQHTKTTPTDPKRDALEFKLLNDAIEEGKPVLGICRGMQLINVHFKGSLHQDIRGFYAEKAQISSIFPKKRVLIKDGSLLCSVLNSKICNVNALHNQAINRVGDDLRIVAREKDTDVFQAIEHPGFDFLIGVQWHPEYLIQIKKQRNLFKMLVKTATSSI